MPLAAPQAKCIGFVAIPPNVKIFGGFSQQTEDLGHINCFTSSRLLAH